MIEPSLWPYGQTMVGPSRLSLSPSKAGAASVILFQVVSAQMIVFSLYHVVLVDRRPRRQASRYADGPGRALEA